MKLQKSSGLPKKPKFFIRRVSGNSMLPTLRPGQIVIALASRNVLAGDVVVISHNNIEKIKRVSKVTGSDIYALGDNPQLSTDSRTFGLIPFSSVLGVVRIVLPSRKHKELRN